MRLTTTITTFAVICGATVGAIAQDTVPAVPIIPAASTDTKVSTSEVEGEASTVVEIIKKATVAYDRSYAEFMAKLRAEKDRDKVIGMYHQRPLPTKEVDMILKFAKDDPKGEGIEEALVWCLRTPSKVQREQIGQMLLTHYKDSKSLGRLAQSWQFDEAKLREIIAKAGDETVRQGATYLLAAKMIRSEESKEDGLALLKKIQSWPGIAESNAQLLAQVNGNVFALEKLSIGRKAPDIVGTDHEDKEFKLSDYKGQVVLLDFWGIW